MSEHATELPTDFTLNEVATALVAADRADGVAVAAGPRPGDPVRADGTLVDDGSRIWLPRRR